MKTKVPPNHLVVYFDASYPTFAFEGYMQKTQGYQTQLPVILSPNSDVQTYPTQLIIQYRQKLVIL